MSISLDAVCTHDRMDVPERAENTVRPENTVRMIGEILPWVLAQYGIGNLDGRAEEPLDRHCGTARQQNPRQGGARVQ
jgi:hypothetical protein